MWEVLKEENNRKEKYSLLMLTEAVRSKQFSQKENDEDDMQSVGP